MVFRSRQVSRPGRKVDRSRVGAAPAHRGAAPSASEESRGAPLGFANGDGQVWLAATRDGFYVRRKGNHVIRITSGIALGMLLAVAGIAEAKTVSIDFTGAAPDSQGLTQVNKEQDKDGATTVVQRGGKNVATTGNTDKSRYLYLKIDDPTFKQDLKTAWVT